MMSRIVTTTKAYEWLLAVSHMVLIATGSQLTRYLQVEDKTRMTPNVAENWMNRGKRCRGNYERSKDCPASKEMQENLMESVHHQLQEVEKKERSHA